MAQHEVYDNGKHEVEKERRAEEQQPVGDHFALREVSVDEHPVDADGRKCTRERAMYDQQAHHELVVPVAASEVQRQRRNDAYREQRTASDQRRGHGEEDPRTERDVAADDPHTPPHEHIDGAIVLRERKQVGQADQRDECIDGEAPPDVGDPAVEEDRAEHERTHEPKDAHVHVTPRGDHEHEREDDDGDQFDAHGRGCSRSWSGSRAARERPVVRSGVTTMRTIATPMVKGRL
jgi:hypothetical protein